MAATGSAAPVVIALLAVFFVGASAQSGCTSAIIGLSPCLGFITGNSTAPAASCCSQLASVVSTDPQCLCSVLGGGGSQLGIAINQTQALALPGACNVQTPPVSQCKTGAGRPTTSPPTTPSSTSPSTPTAPQGESKTIPGYGSSDASSIKMPLSLASFLGFIWLCV